MIRAGRTELPRILKAGHLKDHGFKDGQVFWSKKIGKYEILVELEGGRLTGVEVDIDWDSPPPVAAGHESRDQEKHPRPPVVTIAVPTDGAGFATFIRSFYDFHPHTVTQPELSAKSEELDAFWARIKS
jgi:hypothetical protein